MRLEHKAKEAERLLNDLVLNSAIDRATTDHLNALGVVDPGDPIEVARLQGVVVALKDIRRVLRSYVKADDKYQGPVM